MMRYNHRLSFRDHREPIAYRIGNAPVEHLPPALE
jgi:hypothetical protein